MYRLSASCHRLCDRLYLVFSFVIEIVSFKSTTYYTLVNHRYDNNTHNQREAMYAHILRMYDISSYYHL